LGVDPTEYVRAAGSKWLIGAVARVFKPGCKCDCCLILEGPQGTLKSTALRTLGEPWFTDDMPELGTKDASLQTRGVWIVELSELDSMGRADVNKIKAFMSRATDRFRPPFGRRPIEAPRECIFAGTVNHSSYLRDETGGRRFWPVKCGLVKIDELRRDRDQLWAEARDLFRAGSNWWLDEKRIIEAAAEQQEERYEGDPWDGLIASYVDGKENVTIEGILSAALEKERGQWTQTDKNRISRSLKMLGWERYQHRQGSNREWRYRLVTSLL
jgi:predicted P-loop ATPase